MERCRAVVPQDVELLADLAGAYAGAGRLADAETVYRDALSLDPTYADVHVRLATLLLQRDGRRQTGDAVDIRHRPSQQS